MSAGLVRNNAIIATTDKQMTITLAVFRNTATRVRKHLLTGYRSLPAASVAVLADSVAAKRVGSRSQAVTAGRTQGRAFASGSPRSVDAGG